MPDEEMTTGEISRALARIETKTDNLQAGFDGWREIVIRLEGDVKSNAEDIADLRRRRDEDTTARKADRKWIVTAIVVPIVLIVGNFVIQLLLRTGGTP